MEVAFCAVRLNELDTDNATGDASGEVLDTAYVSDEEGEAVAIDVFHDGIE
jgi:hypothetical protein